MSSFSIKSDGFNTRLSRVMVYYRSYLVQKGWDQLKMS